MHRSGVFANILVLVLVCAMGMVIIVNVNWSSKCNVLDSENMIMGFFHVILVLYFSISATGRESRGTNLLDGCRHVYLDVGSNIGVQVRKLYQPELYPGAVVLPVFKEAFGRYAGNAQFILGIVLDR